MNKHRIFIVYILTLVVLGSACKRKSATVESLQLPIIHIVTDSEIQWDDRIPCSMAVVDGADSVVWDGKVKFRGGSSSKFFKHSYSVKLSKAQSLCGMPANRSWILNASYIDKTLMRHKLCYDLFNQMGDNDIAPKCAYALLRENGNPQGLYVVMERLNKHVLEIDDSDPEALIFKEPKLFYPDSKMPEKSLFGENYQEQTYPDFEYGDRSDIITAFRDFIVKTSDEEFYSKIGEWIDIQNLIDWHLLLLFTNNGDGVLKNFYLYKKDASTPFRIAIWDCDHSFGRDCDNEKNMLERLLDDRQNILLDRMLKSNDYIQQLQRRYAELRKSGIFSYENIEKMMKENDVYVRAGLEENTRLWPYDSDNYYDAATYDEEYALILEFVKKNLARLDKVIPSMPTDHSGK